MVPKDSASTAHSASTSGRLAGRMKRAWKVALALAAALVVLQQAFGVVGGVARWGGELLTDEPTNRTCSEPDLASVLPIDTGFVVAGKIRGNVAADTTDELALLIQPDVDTLSKHSNLYVLECDETEQWTMSLDVKIDDGDGCHSMLSEAPLLTEEEVHTPLVLTSRCGSGGYLDITVVAEVDGSAAVVLTETGLFQGSYTTSFGSLVIDRGGVLAGYNWDSEESTFRRVLAGPDLQEGTAVVRYYCTQDYLQFEPSEIVIAVGDTVAFIQDTSRSIPCSYRIVTSGDRGLEWVRGVGQVIKATDVGGHELWFDAYGSAPGGRFTLVAR